jgi:hypothetical protein
MMAIAISPRVFYAATFVAGLLMGMSAALKWAL